MPVYLCNEAFKKNTSNSSKHLISMLPQSEAIRGKTEKTHLIQISMCICNTKWKEEKPSKTVKLQVTTVQECWKHSVSTERNQIAEILHFQIKGSAILKKKKVCLAEHFQRQLKPRVMKDGFKK